MSDYTIKKSPWIKFIPAFGAILLLLLLATLAVLWFGVSSGGNDRPGRLATLVLSAVGEADAVVAGSPGADARLASLMTSIEGIRAELNVAGGAAARWGADPNWATVQQAVKQIQDRQSALASVTSVRAGIAEANTELLAAMGNLAASMSSSVLARNQRFLERFELNLVGLSQDLQRLTGSSADPQRAADGIADGMDYVDQIIRGLGGSDTGLGIASVGTSAAAELSELRDVFQQLQSELLPVIAVGEDLVIIEEQRQQLAAAAALLSQRYLALPDEGEVVGSYSLPVLLLGVGLVVLLLMLFAYYRAGDVRRAADIQAAQNERNQYAILRLLDELGSLADGDLTVEATVTEDITGAIADSINYAIEALRDLVLTMKDSAILVAAATKQTDATARHLVKSSETQSKQLAAASESTAHMAVSIEEVSGNAERASDVARHSVDVAHKGGDAVRRTIEGMNTIRETIQDTSKRIKRLGESSQEIGNIVELINDIAEQTNILALNASIQASMAGEAGRGFAVVADEVQRLAERSANATKQIEVLVSTIQSDTNEAVVSMERSTTDVVGGALLAENAGAALEEIEQVSNQIATLVHNISSSASEQTQAATGITRNMSVLKEIGAKTGQHIAITSNAISKLSELAAQLRKSVSGFTLPDQGQGTGVLDSAAVTRSLAGGALPQVSDELPVEKQQRRSV
jgi:twitching motility protein PilJ